MWNGSLSLAKMASNIFVWQSLLMTKFSGTILNPAVIVIDTMKTLKFTITEEV